MELENAVATPPQVVTPPVVQESLDHEDAELTAAREELKAAETAAAQPTTAAEPVAAAEPTAPVATAPEHAKGNPTAAIIAIRKRLQQVEAQNLLLQGQVQAFSQMAQAAQNPDPEPMVAEVDPIQAIHDDLDALAEEFDAGSITGKEWEIKRRALNAKEMELRLAALQPVIQTSPANDLQLEQATAQLETDYPVLQTLTAEHLEPLAVIARHQAQAQGKPIIPGALGTLDLRTRIAQLAQQMYGGGLPSKPQVTTPSLSQEAQARADKLALAASMPPNVSSMGSTASAAPLSEADLSARMVGMTEDEQLALLQGMPGLRLKILGG